MAGEAGKQLNSWELYTRLADGTKLPGSDCRVHQDAYECTIGGPGAPYQDWDLPTLGHAPTTRVSVGIACSWATTSCGMGMTLHEAWVSIYSSRITLVDDSRPAVGGVTGPLVADGWKRGTVPVTIAGATDNAGILALRVTAAGEDLAVRDLACDFTRTRPCADVGTTTLQADTRRLPDGTYPLQVSAVDAARNVTAVRQPIRIDNTPPAPPLPVDALAQRTTLPEATVAWAAPDGQAAPVTTAHWSICGPTGCSTGTRESGAGGALAVPTDAAGTYVVRVSLEDAAGNHDAARTTTWNVTREVEGPSVATPVTTPAPRPPDRPAAPASPAAPAAPRLRLTGAPTVAPDGRTIAVRGSAAAAATGSVEVVVRARIAGRLRRVTRRAAIRERRFAVRLRLPSRAWSTAKVQVRYAGNGRVGASTLTSRVRRPAR